MKDESTGVMGWEVYFNIGLTRLIAFNLDWYWMACNRPINHHKVRYQNSYLTNIFQKINIHEMILMQLFLFFKTNFSISI